MMNMVVRVCQFVGLTFAWRKCSMSGSAKLSKWLIDIKLNNEFNYAHVM